MYHSRLRYTNGCLSLALDPLSGCLTELTQEKTGDNVLKNHLRQSDQPFCCWIRSGTELVKAGPGQFAQICADPSLRPQIEHEQTDDGSQTIRVTYQALFGDGRRFEIAACWTVRLPADGNCLTWRLHLANSCSEALIEKVAFPNIQGVWLGETWTDDVLVCPFFAGERTVNPVAVMAAIPKRINWKWQEYRYTYLMDSLPGLQIENETYYRELPYSGPLSMMWLDYADPDLGLYLGCHETNAKVMALRMESDGPDKPGLGLAIVHHPFLQDGTWQSPPCVLALHEGDWHWGADFYRMSRDRIGDATVRKRPDWFVQSPGLVAHYDFKYQNGGIVHRFSDIPVLLGQAQAMGLTHLLLSGWHQDGFDNGFPEYRPDPDLGTEQDLVDALATVRARGGHVAFYVNARLSNTCYEHRRQERQDCCAKRPDGTYYAERYGDKGITFETYCAQSPVWQKQLADVVTYLTGTIGADSVYLDQLGMAPPLFCFHPDHMHGPTDWNRGYQQFITGLFNRYDAAGTPAVLYEGVSDLYGAGVSGQLISTFVHHHNHAYPELYKFTYPEQILVDMIYPRRGQAMRPVHVADQGRTIMDRAFVIGSYYWVYDLEEDNTFRNDPQAYAHLCRMTALRRSWLARFGHGRFRDTEGIIAVPDGVLAKRFVLDDETVLLAVANPAGTASGTILMDRSGMPVRLDAASERGRINVQVLTAYNPEHPEAVTVQSDQDGWHIPLYAAELLLYQITGS